MKNFKFLILAVLASIGVISESSFAAGCPDFTGIYTQSKDSTRGDFKNSTGWPLQKLDTTVTIVQKGCEEIEFSFPNSRYSNAPVEVVNLDLTKATSLNMGENQIYLKQVTPLTRVNGLGATLKSSTSDELIMKLDSQGISIHSISKMKGIYNYLIPVISRDSFSYRLERK